MPYHQPNAQGLRPAARLSLWKRLVVWWVLACFSTMSLGQAVGPIILDGRGAPMTGYSAQGTYVENGRTRGNPHQILHDLVNGALWTSAAMSFSNTTDPQFVHPTLTQMENALAPSPGGLSISVLSIGANPYTSSTLPNAASNSVIYDQAATDARAQSGVQMGSNPELVALGSAALLSSPVFSAAQGPGGSGAVGVIVSQSPEAVAHLSALRTANAAILGSPIYYTQHQVDIPHFVQGGWSSGNSDQGSDAVAPLDGAALGRLLTHTTQSDKGLTLGYIQDNGQAHQFDLQTNPYFTPWNLQALQDIPSAAPELLGQNLRTAARQHTKGQKAVGDIDFGYFKDDVGLFMQGFDITGYANSAQEKELLLALRNGSIPPGDARYAQARALAEGAFRQGWASHIEFETKLVYNRESAHWQAQHLPLERLGDRELFQKGLNLYCGSCDARPEALLRQLEAGSLKDTDAGYQEARDLAEARFKLAYENSLIPPKKKSLFKQLVAVVVAAVAAYFVQAWAANWASSLLGSTTASTVSSVVAAGIGTTAAGMTSSFLSTTILTGDPKQGFKAAGKALTSGLVATAINTLAPGLDLPADSWGAKAINVAATAAGQTAAYRGSFLNNLGAAALNQGAADASKEGAEHIGTQLSTVQQPLQNIVAHAILGCSVGMVKAQSGKGCVPGAAGAMAGDWAGQQAEQAGWSRGASTLAADTAGGLAGALAGGKDRISENYQLGASAGHNAFENNYLTHKERTDLQRAEKECYLNGQQCDTAAALRRKDELSDKLLANAVATCEGAECQKVSDYIQRQAEKLGCTTPSAWPDQETLNRYWKTVQEKSQGLEPVYPETWLLDAKAAYDLGKWGVQVATSAGGSLEALGKLAEAGVSPGGVADIGLGTAKVVEKDFFAGTKYTDKVLVQMKQGDFHSFPESVRGFQDTGSVSKLTGGDGVVREILKIPGNYQGKDGFFEFIKEVDGSINHRLFRPISEK